MLVYLVPLLYTLQGMKGICLSVKHMCQFFWDPIQCDPYHDLLWSLVIALQIDLETWWLFMFIWVPFVTYPYHLLFCICDNFSLDTIKMLYLWWVDGQIIFWIKLVEKRATILTNLVCLLKNIDDVFQAHLCLLSSHV